MSERRYQDGYGAAVLELSELLIDNALRRQAPSPGSRWWVIRVEGPTTKSPIRFCPEREAVLRAVVLGGVLGRVVRAEPDGW